MTQTAAPWHVTVASHSAAVLQRGYLRRHETRRAFVLAFGAVAILELVHVLAVASKGSEPGPHHQLAYPAILLAGYLFGMRGSLVTACVASIVSGAVALAPPVDVDTLVLRVGFFVGLAAVTGFLFDELRGALDNWRTTAVRVAQREREGMVALARGAEAKDTDTGDHVMRVHALSERLALAAGMDGPGAAAIGWAAMLHDVGKLHVPDSVLLKPGPLDDDEWRVMRMHPVWGEEILGEGDGFEIARRIARWHHENIDGTGYPDGLRGERIPLEARIVRVADAMDAITHDRPYRRARSLEWAMAELKRYAGRQFDPELVRLLLDIIETDRAFADAIVRSDLATLAPGRRALSPMPMLDRVRLLAAGELWDRP
jgi:hypothetical protein